MTVLEDKKKLETLVRNLNFVFKEAQERTNEQLEDLEDFNLNIRSKYDEVNYLHYMSEIYRTFLSQTISKKRDIMKNYGIELWEN